MKSRKTVALILGGGQGKRLFPLTEYRSKPAVPIGGKYRLIDIPISNCLHSGLKDIYVLTQFNSESLNNHINNTYRFDYFSRAFVRILAAEQTVANTTWFQGTADAVRRNIAHLNLRGDEDILILSGDHLYNMDYRELVGFHRKSNADFTVSVIPVKENQISQFGIMRIGSSHGISEFREKPKNQAGLKHFKSRGRYIASMGVYVFTAPALMKALEGPAADFGKEVMPQSINTLKGCAYVFEGYWRDVGTIRSFYDANMELANHNPKLSFFYYGTLFTRPRFLPSARIANCRIARSFVSEGSVIGGSDIKSSIIGLRSIVGNGCRISRTVMMGADYYEPRDSRRSIKIGLGDGCAVDRAIIDKNAAIGKNVVIRNDKGLKNFDGGSYFIRDGIVIIPKNARIKAGAHI